jgi:hypothetical protein
MTRTTLALYRNVLKEQFPHGPIVNDHAVQGVLYPSFEDTIVPTADGKSKPRQADIYPYPYEGKDVVDPGGGASLFDKPNLFGTKKWWNFTIPKNTPIPASLQVVYTGHNERYNADHYRIEPASRRMPVDAYKGALDNLARNAVVQQNEDARKGK